MPYYLRNRGTTTRGGSFSKETINKVWAKGKSIPGYSSNEYRRDVYGSAMRYSDYGDRSSVYGWEIDHINPVSNGGTDDLWNLQPLQWENNLKKGDSIPRKAM